MKSISDAFSGSFKRLPTISKSTERCEECDKFMFKDGDREFCFYCEEVAAEDKRLSKETEMIHENMEFKKIFDSFKGQSLINPKLLNATFENYVPLTEKQERAKRVCWRYANNFDLKNPVSLILIGSYGVGKSHLSVSITKEVMKKQIPSLFISVPKLLTKLKSSWKGTTSEYDILQAIETVPLLVLDDIGAEADDEKQNIESKVKTKLFEIIDGRSGRHTIFTTNFSVDKIQAFYGERNASRMLEGATKLILDGENHRTRES